MIVYVESNYIIELVLQQEQFKSCSAILDLAEKGKIELIIPAFCFTEIYEALGRKRSLRKELANNINTQLDQLSRSALYAESTALFKELVILLTNSYEQDLQSLHTLHDRLLSIAQVVPLTDEVLKAASKSRTIYNLEPQDSVVFASTLIHQSSVSKEEDKCFFNRNSKDFKDPDIIETLKKNNCVSFFNFDDGYKYLIRKRKQ